MGAHQDLQKGISKLERRDPIIEKDISKKIGYSWIDRRDPSYKNRIGSVFYEDCA